jgi:hypothetical protein
MNLEKSGNNQISFADYFISKMNDYYQKGLENYFKSNDTDKIIDKIRFLMIETGADIKLKTFLENSQNIPFRFFKFIYNNQNYFKLSGLNEENNIFLEYQSPFVVNCLFNYYTKFINEKKLYITANFDKNLNSIKLEDSVSLYLWATRNKSPIKGLIIKDFIIIDSIFEPKENDLELLKLKINELKNDIVTNIGILICNLNQNAAYFDTCIIKKNVNNKFETYFFQSTIKKDAEERFTLTFLNENLSYITGLYEVKFDIIIEKYYFYYIFDEKSQDLRTMKECSNILLY